MIIKDGDFPIDRKSQHSQHYVGHTHFWERAMMSRRKFMAATAATTGVVLGSGLWMPKFALAAGSDPKPIPGGFAPGFHVFLLGEGNEPSTITDFNGFVGVADVQGTGKAINTRTGFHETLNYDTDMRFMQGTYIGMDGNQYSDTFGFI